MGHNQPFLCWAGCVPSGPHSCQHRPAGPASPPAGEPLIFNPPLCSWGALWPLVKAFRRVVAPSFKREAHPWTRSQRDERRRRDQMREPRITAASEDDAFDTLSSSALRWSSDDASASPARSADRDLVAVPDRHGGVRAGVVVDPRSRRAGGRMHVRTRDRGDLSDAPQADRRLGTMRLAGRERFRNGNSHDPGRHGRRDRRADSLDSANDSVESRPGWRHPRCRCASRSARPASTQDLALYFHASDRAR